MVYGYAIGFDDVLIHTILSIHLPRYLYESSLDSILANDSTNILRPRLRVDKSRKPMVFVINFCHLS